MAVLESIRDAMSATSVLAVDDDPDFLTELGERLEADRIPSQSVTNAYDAMRMLTTNSHISVVVSDLRMPGLGGFELMRMAGSLAPERQLSWIFVSGRAGVHEAVTALRTGAVDFLEKPVDPDVLIASIRRAQQAQPGPATPPILSPSALDYGCVLRLLETVRLAAKLLAPEPKALSSILAILHEAVLAERAGRPRSLTTVGLDSDESASTINRRIQDLVEADVLIICEDSQDGRRKLVRLNPEVESRAGRLLDEIRSVLG